jgi:hypothetical protein
MADENFDEIRQFPLLTTLPKPRTAKDLTEVSRDLHPFPHLYRSRHIVKEKQQSNLPSLVQ